MIPRSALPFADGLDIERHAVTTAVRHAVKDVRPWLSIAYQLALTRGHLIFGLRRQLQLAAPATERNLAVAGVSDEDEAAAAPVTARPQAVLSATGTADAATWIMLALACLVVATGASLRRGQIQRHRA